MKQTRLNRYTALIAAVLIVIISSPSRSQTVPDSAVAGNWLGTLHFGNTSLRVVFHITRTDSNTLAATLDSPDQGATGIPVSSVRTAGDSIFLDVAAVRGGFEGIVAPDKASISGSWKQMNAALPLTLTRTKTEIRFNRPQEPRPPFPYRSEDVTYENTVEGVKLAGTLTLPEKGGPFPAAILITGSGPQNRDEELFGHKPFLVIADYLTKMGIAVLRVDDRGVGGSSGGYWSNSTTADYATDVMAGIKYLKTRADIDHSKIGLIGHSEGGIIAPMVAAKSRDVAFVVMLAGTGYSGDKIILSQTRLLEKADGVPPGKIEEEEQRLKEEINIVESGKDSLAIAERLADYLSSNFSKWGTDYVNSGLDSTEIIRSQIRNLDSRWFRFFLTYNPIPALEQVKCPVLAMDGTLDLQVPGEENLKAIGDALKRGGNKDWKTVLIPGLNHLFQDAKTGSEKEYAQIEETFSPKALKIMGDWITRRFVK